MLVLRGPVLASARNLRLILIRDGAVVSTTPITAEVQTVEADMPIGPRGGYVRAELRSEPFTAPNPIGSRLDMEAFTNPIFLVNGPKPDEVQPEFAPPPRRAADRARRRRQHLGAVAGAAAVAAVAGPQIGAWDLPLSGVALRAATGTSLSGRTLRLRGQVTAVAPDRVVLTRWTPDSCSPDGHPVDVVLLLDGIPTDGLEGAWVRAEAPGSTGLPRNRRAPPRCR